MPSGNEMADEHAERPVAAQKPPPELQEQTETPSSPAKRKSSNWKRPPHGGKYSKKNAHTSVRSIAMRRLQAEALSLREQGYSYEQISTHMKRPMTTVYRWVSDAIDAIVQEPAARVLKLELQRLDAYLAAYHANAVEGDLPATEMALRIIEKRARLLGLFPEQGKQSALAVRIGDDGKPQTTIHLEFVAPTWKPDDDEPVRLPAPKDVTPQPAPRVDYSPPLEPPVIDAVVNPPNSGVPIMPKRRSWMD
jgi:hypothetical protein